VLVVDDDECVRELMGLVLEGELGIRPVLVEDGAQALRALHECEAKLVVTDVQMPNVDGIEFIRTIRASPAHRALPVMVVSASPDARRAALAAGGDDYLDKPFDLDALVAKASRYLAA
jgi:CheY-like chemotaxis protein